MIKSQFSYYRTRACGICGTEHPCQQIIEIAPEKMNAWHRAQRMVSPPTWIFFLVLILAAAAGMLVGMVLGYFFPTRPGSLGEFAIQTFPFYAVVFLAMVYKTWWWDERRKRQGLKIQGQILADRGYPKVNPDDVGELCGHENERKYLLVSAPHLPL